VLGFQMQVSDDGRFALVEMVFQSPTTFQGVLQKQAASIGVAIPQTGPKGKAVSAGPASPAIPVISSGPSAAQVTLEAAVPGLKMFERGKAKEADVVNYFKQYKRDFRFDPTTTVRVR